MRGATSRTVLFAPENFNLAEVTHGIEVARRMDGACVFACYSARDAYVVEERPGFIRTRTRAADSAQPAATVDPAPRGSR